MTRLSLAALLALVPLSADTRWHRVESGRWELLTDMGEKTGVSVMRQMTEMQSVFGAMAMPLPDSAPPVRIIVMKNAKDFAPFRVSETNRGLFQSGADRDYILLLDAGDDTLRAARHEFVHLVLHHTAAPLPKWLEEGLAEYFSTLQRKGGTAIAGRPIPSHLQILSPESSSAPAWLDAVQLASARETSLQFYAQSWAVTSVLMKEPNARARIAVFAKEMQSGVEQSAAFQRAFGKPLSAYIDEARRLASLKSFPTTETSLGAVPEAAALPAREIPEAEARLARADALVAYGGTAEAAAIYNDILRKSPNSPAALTGLGTLALKRSDYDAARGYLEKAIAADDSRASTYFEYAMLIRDTRGPEPLVMDSLSKAVQRSPSYAEAWYLMGSSLLRQTRPAEAIEPLKRATEILPHQSLFWEALGRAYLDNAQRELARDAAQRAVISARTPEQSAMAQGLVREIEATPANRPPKKPSVATPQSWHERKPDATLAGKLVFLDCNTAIIKFVIETKPAAGRVPAERAALTAEKLNQITLKGATSQKREFVCGPQQPAPPVEAGYIAKPQPAPEPPKAEAAKPEPAPAKAPAKAPSKAAAKGAKKAPAKAPAKRPAAPVKPKPVEPPVRGELIWLEFK